MRRGDATITSRERSQVSDRRSEAGRPLCYLLSFKCPIWTCDDATRSPQKCDRVDALIVVLRFASIIKMPFERISPNIFIPAVRASMNTTWFEVLCLKVAPQIEGATKRTATFRTDRSILCLRGWSIRSYSRCRRVFRRIMLRWGNGGRTLCGWWGWGMIISGVQRRRNRAGAPMSVYGLSGRGKGCPIQLFIPTDITCDVIFANSPECVGPSVDIVSNLKVWCWRSWTYGSYGQRCPWVCGGDSRSYFAGHDIAFILLQIHSSFKKIMRRNMRQVDSSWKTHWAHLHRPMRLESFLEQ